MLIARENGWYSTLSNKEYEFYNEALLYDRYKQFEKFISGTYYAHDGEWVYIYDEYLYERWLIYLTLLQCTIHPNLVKNCGVLEDLVRLKDTIPENQKSIPSLFMKYRGDFKGKGWYAENSVFGPVQDLIGIDYKEAKDNPLSDETMAMIEMGNHRTFSGWL